MSDTNRPKPYRRSPTEKLESMRIALLSQVEMAPGYSISRRRSERTMAWTFNPAEKQDLANAHRAITDSIVEHVYEIAKKFISNAESRLDEQTVTQLSDAIVTCHDLTEKLRPVIGEGWPPSPPVETIGAAECAKTMIEQIRAEVKRCNDLGALRDTGRW